MLKWTRAKVQQGRISKPHNNRSSRDEAVQTLKNITADQEATGLCEDPNESN